MRYDVKEVDFYKYCKTCKHWNKLDYEYPCDECLDNPTNMNSHKPVNYQESDRKEK